MRVGVYLGNQPPDIGGGYTFQDDVFRSFLQIAGQSRHHFVILGHQGYGRQSLPTNVKLLAAAGPGLVERTVGALLPESVTLRKLNALRKQWAIPINRWESISKLNRVARAAEVEFLWFVSPVSIAIDIPYLTVVWDLQHRLQPWFPEVSYQGEWDRREAAYAWYLRRATRIITGNRAGQAEIESLYQIPANRIRILPHPTPSFALTSDSARPAQSILLKYKLPKGYLFYPAQFWAHKNHANLIQALALLRDRHSIHLPLVCAGGDRGNLSYIKALVSRLGLESKVHFLGFVPQVDLVNLYRNAFALAYVSFFGPENLPPLEAFALNCPVIASAVSGAEEQLGDAALLVRPESPEEIMITIKSLLENSALSAELVAKGRERALKFSGRHFVQGIFDILDEFESIRKCWV